MGTWKITIEGHGIHHNGDPKDANTMAEEFFAALLAAGHDHLTGSFQLTPDGVPEEFTAAE